MALFGWVISCSYLIYTGSYSMVKFRFTVQRRGKQAFAGNQHQKDTVREGPGDGTGSRSALRFVNVLSGCSILESRSALEINNHISGHSVKHCFALTE